MVRQYEGGHLANEERVARLTGLLAACFCGAQFLTSFAWGLLSDRVGRKACPSDPWTDLHIARGSSYVVTQLLPDDVVQCM